MHNLSAVPSFVGACVKAWVVQPYKVAAELRETPDAFVKFTQVILNTYKLAEHLGVLALRPLFHNKLIAIDTMDNGAGVLAWFELWCNPVRSENVEVQFEGFIEIADIGRDLEAPAAPRRRKGPARDENEDRITSEDLDNFIETFQFATPTIEIYRDIFFARFADYIVKNKGLANEIKPDLIECFKRRIQISEGKSTAFSTVHTLSLRVLEAGAAILQLGALGLSFNPLTALASLANSLGQSRGAIFVATVVNYTTQNRVSLGVVQFLSNQAEVITSIAAISFFGLNFLKSGNEWMTIYKEMKATEGLTSSQKQAASKKMDAALWSCFKNGAEFTLSLASFVFMNNEQKRVLMLLNVLGIFAKSTGAYDYLSQAIAKVKKERTL